MTTYCHVDPLPPQVTDEALRAGRHRGVELRRRIGRLVVGDVSEREHPDPCPPGTSSFDPPLSGRGSSR